MTQDTVRIAKIVTRGILAMAVLIFAFVLAYENLLKDNTPLLYVVVATLGWFNGKLNAVIEKIIQK